MVTRQPGGTGGVTGQAHIGATGVAGHAGFYDAQHVSGGHHPSETNGRPGIGQTAGQFQPGPGRDTDRGGERGRTGATGGSSAARAAGATQVASATGGNTAGRATGGSTAAETGGGTSGERQAKEGYEAAGMDGRL